jgi:formylglycine-generating enzyme required for sulfatase activity
MSEKRLALLIASYQYEDPGLRQLVTPPQDAGTLAQVLQDPAMGNFDEVKMLVNEPETFVSREIARFYHQKKKDDLLLLYFSGHGVLDERGQLYLAVKDTERDFLSATAIPAAYISEAMDNSRSRRQVLILDCCHSGAFGRTKRAIGSSVGTARAFEGNGYGRIVLTASDVTEYAWEGDQVKGEAETSVFTHHLVQGLRTGEADKDADGLITLDELYDYVYEQVVTQASKQTPGKFSYKQQGQIIIARNPSPVVKPAELPTELHQAIGSLYPGIRKGAVDELSRLLHGSDKGLALAAQEALERLADNDSHQVSAAATEALGRTTKPSPASPSLEPLAERDKVRSTPKPAPPKPDILTITRPIDLELVRIPAGEFLMGSDPSIDRLARDDEQPQHPLHLPDYYIGKTPVTNVQYAAFVQMTRHKKPNHWKKGKIPNGRENHPVVWISWKDAVAFCKWLSQETGQPFRLPTEAEWEKAARGTDGRIYPWDNQWDAKRCNTSESGVGQTTPVDAYPNGASPYGVLDMAGNVWEWALSLWGKDLKKPDFKYPYDPEDGREETQASDVVLRVVRGGSFYVSQDLARCAGRGKYVSKFRDAFFGFRVVVSPISSSAL